MRLDSFLSGLSRLLGPFFFELLGACFVYTSFQLLTLEPQLQTYLAFGILCSVIGIALLIYGMALHAVQLGQINSIRPVYDELKRFFSSPLFFILYGSFLLYAGLALLDYTHSAFVFILSILGVAMVLFGSGSQAVAAAEIPYPTAGKINVAIAGGAAALAAIFGYGTVYLSEGIQGFFKRSVDYGFLELTTRDSPSPNLDLEQHFVAASLSDGRPLHFWKTTSELQIMVPRYERHAVSHVLVTIKGPQVSVGSSSRTPPEPYEISWQEVTAEPIFANEKIYIKRLKFKLPSTQTTQTDESGQPATPTVLSPN
jgi:hypothetical protein